MLQGCRHTWGRQRTQGCLQAQRSCPLVSPASVRTPVFAGSFTHAFLVGFYVFCRSDFKSFVKTIYRMVLCRSFCLLSSGGFLGGGRLAGLICWSVGTLGRGPFLLFLTLTLISMGALLAARFWAGWRVTSKGTYPLSTVERGPPAGGTVPFVSLSCGFYCTFSTCETGF